MRTKEFVKRTADYCPSFESRTSIQRGEIYYADFGAVIGSEQGGIRPVLVVQNNVGNKHSPTIIVLPITRHLKKSFMPTHIFLPTSSGLKEKSMALAEQIRTIDRSRLREYIGRISGVVQRKVDTALAVSIGLSNKS